MLTTVGNFGIGTGGSCICFGDDYLDSVVKAEVVAVARTQSQPRSETVRRL
jgi:hypothetical protein